MMSLIGSWFGGGVRSGEEEGECKRTGVALSRYIRYSTPRNTTLVNDIIVYIGDDEPLTRQRLFQ